MVRAGINTVLRTDGNILLLTACYFVWDSYVSIYLTLSHIKSKISLAQAVILNARPCP